MLIQNNYKPEIIRDKNIKPNLFYGRINFFILIIFVLFCIFILRLIGMVNNNTWKKQANNVSVRNIQIIAERGKILDRNGNILAIDQIVKNIIIDTHQLPNFDDLRIKNPRLKRKIDKLEQEFHLKLIKLAEILNISNDSIFKRFNYKTYLNKKHGDIYLKRKVDKNVSSQIESLNIQGLKITSDSMRRYPENKLFAQIVGISKQELDSNTKKEKIIGLEGIEYAYNNILEGHNGLKVMFKDNKGRFIKEKDSPRNKIPVDGENIVLSVDKNIQTIVYNRLLKAIYDNNAQGGSIVVLDYKNGEILAMANYPGYDPENFLRYSSESRKNKAVVDLIEPGSTIKPFIVSAALDKGLIDTHDIFDTQPYFIGKYKIKDVHNYGILNVKDIIKKSSNVGISQIGLKLSSEDFYNYLNIFGLGIKPNSGFPGEPNPILKGWDKWSNLDQVILSYGYGIQVSLLQLARAYTIFVNNGKLLPVTFLKNGNKGSVGVSVISEQTALKVKEMLFSVTEAGGTGTLASIDGYKVAGKTGTSEKNINRKYLKNSHISLFIGFIDDKDNSIIVAINIDNPRKNGYYGGQIAAPVFSDIVKDILKINKRSPVNY